MAKKPKTTQASAPAAPVPSAAECDDIRLASTTAKGLKKKAAEAEESDGEGYKTRDAKAAKTT